MRIAVLAKQIPSPSQMMLVDGRLVRDRVRLETNSYCRRANTRAVELAGQTGEVVVFTMGPPTAEQTLREMIACGASRGVLLTDRTLAGSDTLITARVLARAVELQGPFDMVLAGAYSLDSETGHIGVQVAQLLALPFIGPCRMLEVIDGVAVATVECKGGFADAEVLLPTVASVAERLCAPSKASPEQCAAVPDDKITYLSAADLGLSEVEVGLNASPTQVGNVLSDLVGYERTRAKAASVEAAILVLDGLNPADATSVTQREEHDCPVRGDAEALWCVLDPGSEHRGAKLLHAVTDLARAAGRPVVAVTSGAVEDLNSSVDHILRFSGPSAPEDWAAPFCERLKLAVPHCVIAEASNWGREFAARAAAHCGWGLVGDAVKFTVERGTIIAWKSALSGQAMVPITSTSPTLLATTRPGTLNGSEVRRRAGKLASVETVATESLSRVVYDPARAIDAVGEELEHARCVVIVGSGVAPDEYGAIDELRRVLGAGPLAATRKVTDRGWLPRTRQVGLTGRSVAPELLVSIAARGTFNHCVGFVGARRVLAINCDPNAEIFQYADVGIVGDWHQIVSELCDALRDEFARPKFLIPN